MQAKEPATHADHRAALHSVGSAVDLVRIAQGVIMALEGTDPASALGVLRAAAQRQGRSLDSIASSVVACYSSPREAS